jgi:hypothetical protein
MQCKYDVLHFIFKKKSKQTIISFRSEVTTVYKFEFYSNKNNESIF